jgi:hypothetical protein
MSYPRVFAVWRAGCDFFRWYYRSREEADSWLMGSPDAIVELVPLPEVESMLAAAVAAERERCIAAIENTDIAYPSDTRYSQLGDARETMANAIEAIRKGGDA